MKKLLAVLMIAALAVTMVAGSCWAKGAPNNHENNHERMQKPAPLDLQLTDAQKEKIEKLSKEFEKDNIDFRYDMKKSKENLHKAWAERPLDSKKINAASEADNNIRIKSIERREKFAKDFRAILTAEQIKKLDAFKEEQKNKKDERMQKNPYRAPKAPEAPQPPVK